MLSLKYPFLQALHNIEVVWRVAPIPYVSHSGITVNGKHYVLASESVLAVTTPLILSQVVQVNLAPTASDTIVATEQFNDESFG